MSDPQISSAPIIPAWTCEARVFDAADAAALDQLHVGDPYLINCRGDVVADLLIEKTQLAAIQPPKSYGMHILKVRTLDNKEIWAEATSYKPGSQSFSEFQIVSGGVTIPLQGGQLTIQSVLAQKPPEQMNHPDAMKMTFLGPFTLAMPLWYWAVWLGVVILGSTLVARIIWKKVRRRKLLDSLARQATALTPYNQFNKELRQHLRDFSVPNGWEEKGSQALVTLDQSFRMYLLRELLVPANEWTTGAVMRDIRARHKKLYRTIGPQVRRTLIEFDRAKRDQKGISFNDCEQLRDMSRRTVDQLYKMKRFS